MGTCRMRKNIQVLDESIESVSEAPRNEKPASRCRVVEEFELSLLITIPTTLPEFSQLPLTGVEDPYPFRLIVN